jgi:hypothetical protein
MRYKSTFILLAALLVQSVTFSQSNPLLKYIPDDVTTIIHFDIKSMGSKIPSEDFRQSFMYREMMKKEGMPFSTLFSQPEKWGIDLTAGIIMALNYQGKGRFGQVQPSVHLFMKLQNGETFTNNIKELMKDGKEKELIKVYGTDRIISVDGSVTAGWNNDVFVFTTGNKQELEEEIYTTLHFSDTTALIDTAVRTPFDYEKMMEKFKKSQRDLCFQLLTPKNNRSFDANSRFNEIMNSKADIKMWSNGSSNLMTENMLPISGILNKLQALSGKNRTALINFEDGRIVVKSRNFPEGEIAEIYKKHPATIQNTNLVRRLPEGKLLGLMNISFSQEMCNELMQKSGLLEILDSLKTEIPFDISLAKDVFKSDMMLAVLKNENTIVLDSLTGILSNLDGFQVILAMPIADKVKFEKLKSAIMPLWDSISKKEDFRIKNPSPVAKYNDDMLVLSLSEAAATAYLNNSGTGEIPESLTAYSQYPMVVDINMREILSYIIGIGRPNRENNGSNEMLLNTFGNIIVYGGEYENESINSTMEFRIGNKNENSLKQLFSMMNSMIEESENKIISGENDENSFNRNNILKDNVTLVDITQEEKKIIPPPPPPPPPPPKTPPPKVKMQKFTPPVIKKDN